MPKSREVYYQRLFEDAPIGIYRCTPDGKLIDANKTLVDMLGYPDLQSLMEVNLADLFVDPQKRVEELSLLIQFGTVKSFESQFRCRDGNIICVRDTLRVIKGDDGIPIYHEGVLEDITERVQAKMALFESRSRIEAERAQRQLAETLREIANLITGSLEFDKVTQQIFDNLGRLLPFDSAGLFLLHPDGYLRMAASIGVQNSEQLTSLRIELDRDPLSREILETKQPLLLENATGDPRFQNYGSVADIKNWLGVPLIIREEAIGLLTLDSQTANVYQEREVQLALILASQIATAIENARLFEAERHRADIMSALRATLADLTAELDLSTLLQSILVRAVKLLNATGGELALYEDTENSIEIVACHNMDRDYTGRKMEPGQGAIGHVIITGEPISIDDYKTWEGHLSRYFTMPWKAVIAVPLKARDRTLGVIALADASQERLFDQDDLRLISLFANQAAIAIENAQLFDLISSALTNTQTLYQTARALIATENLQDLFQNLVNQVGKTLPAGRVILITLDLENQEVTNYVMGGNQADKLVPASFQELMDGLTGWVIRERKSALSSKSGADPREQAYVSQKRKESMSGSLIVVPLLYRRQILGTLTAINNPDAREYTQTDVDLLEIIASHAAVAIKNAQLFEEVQKLAETDDLTNINNRRQLFALGDREFERSNRYNTPLSVIMLDIDGFKAINDTYGHAVGDIVLHSLAQHCLGEIREVDIIGRYGGEEFVILLPHTTLNQGYEIAERLREHIESIPISTKIGALKISISLGVAEKDPSIPNLAALIDRADTALYKAKNAGKNRVEIYERRIDLQSVPISK